LGETVADFPVVVNAMRGVKLTRIGRRCEAFVKKAFESFDLVLSRFQVVTWAATCKSAKHQRAFCGENWQFEEGVGDLEHEYVRVTVVVHDEDAFDRASHSKVLIVVL
jgi:hypothetical protein